MITVYKEWINGLEKHTVETDHELNDNGDARFKMNIAKNETVFKLKVSSINKGEVFATPVLNY